MNKAWNNEKTIEELRIIINQIHHFPTIRELSEINRNDLNNVISRNGGINKFRELLGYPIKKRGNGYWTKENTILNLNLIINNIGHFPTQNELENIGRDDLRGAIYLHGGIEKFRLLLGYNLLQKPIGFWTEEKTIDELKVLITSINHFPSQKELHKLNRYDLNNAIRKNGGYPRFRQLMGYEIIKKSNGYWTEEKIIKELALIIDSIGHFPTQDELLHINKSYISSAIRRKGGLNKFRLLLGYETIKHARGYWTDDMIVSELKFIINKLGHFPSDDELKSMNKTTLSVMMWRNGGYHKFRTLVGADFVKMPNHYWSDEKIINELNLIINKLKRFPTQRELIKMDKGDLVHAMFNNGGVIKYIKLLGYLFIYKGYISATRSYVTKRGKNSEIIVRYIIEDYCKINNIPPPSYNVKLSKGNVVEFVCDTGKKIGIDVTNNKTSKSSIVRKWTRKDYYKHLDELWIVVFSDLFTNQDYNKFNYISPPNVKVMSIYQFIEELNYSLDEHTKSKIDKYCKCNFHTKEEFIKSKPSNTDKDTLNNTT